MKTALPLLAIIAMLTGCQLAPVKTTFDVQRPDGLGLSYASEKDVIYEKTVTLSDGTVEQTKFQALASAAALADVERQRVQAEVNAKNADIALEAIKMLPVNTLP